MFEFINNKCKPNKKEQQPRASAHPQVLHPRDLEWIDYSDDEGEQSQSDSDGDDKKDKPRDSLNTNQ